MPMRKRTRAAHVWAAAAVLAVGAGTQAYAAPPHQASLFFVQAGAFREAAHAAARCNALAAAGYAVEATVARGTHFILCRSRATLPRLKAAALAAQIRASGLSNAVVVPTGTSASLAPPTGWASSPSSLSGAWCGNPKIHGHAPLQIWQIGGAEATILLRLPLGSTPAFEVYREHIGVGSGSRIRLTEDAPLFRSETIYAIRGNGLKGILYRQVMKRSGERMKTVPDALHRCDP